MNKSLRANSKLEVEYLVKLYQFYNDNFYYLQFNDDFKQVMRAQEERVIYILQSMHAQEEKIACMVQSMINKDKGEE